MKPIKTAILGYGRSGSTLHADPIEALPEFEVVSVCDINPEARDAAKSRFGCAVYDNHAEMLKNEPDLEFVVVVTFSSQHADMACDCLNAGKNVLVTKPWAQNEAEALRMIEASKKSGKLLMPWLPARYGEDLTELKRIVASGAIGKIFMVRRSVNTLGIRCDWQTQKAYGGGYLMNWGPHLVDQPLQLIGEPAKSVYGVMKQVRNPGDAEDVFYAVIATQSGANIITEFNFCAPGLPQWVVQGDAGTIYVRDCEVETHAVRYPVPPDPNGYSNRPEITVTKSADGAVDPKYVYGDAFKIYAHIAKALRGAEEYYAPAGDGLALTRVLDAIRKSAGTGAVVEL